MNNAEGDRTYQEATVKRGLLTARETLRTAKDMKAKVDATLAQKVDQLKKEIEDNQAKETGFNSEKDKVELLQR